MTDQNRISPATIRNQRPRVVSRINLRGRRLLRTRHPGEVSGRARLLPSRRCDWRASPGGSPLPESSDSHPVQDDALASSTSFTTSPTLATFDLGFRVEGSTGGPSTPIGDFLYVFVGHEVPTPPTQPVARAHRSKLSAARGLAPSATSWWTRVASASLARCTVYSVSLPKTCGSLACKAEDLTSGVNIDGRIDNRFARAA